MFYPPLSPGVVAEIICRYRRGESTPHIARALRLDNATVVEALDSGGIGRHSAGDTMRGHGRDGAPRCRCCGILLSAAEHHDGACDDCWDGAAVRAQRWGVGAEEAMTRWIEEGKRIERGDADLEDWCKDILGGGD